LSSFTPDPQELLTAGFLWLYFVKAMASFLARGNLLGRICIPPRLTAETSIETIEY